jgi:hypothetical protein
MHEIDNRLVFGSPDPFRLDVGSGTFFGLDEAIFRQLVAVARQGPTLVNEIRPLENIQPFYSAISVLRDGSVIGPLEFFTAVGPATY